VLQTKTASAAPPRAQPAATCGLADALERNSSDFIHSRSRTPSTASHARFISLSQDAV